MFEILQCGPQNLHVVYGGVPHPEPHKEFFADALWGGGHSGHQMMIESKKPLLWRLTGDNMPPPWLNIFFDHSKSWLPPWLLLKKEMATSAKSASPLAFVGKRLGAVL